MRSSKVNEVNTTRVLQQIWMSGGTTRVALARTLGLVKSTVSRITSLLIEQ
jgi:DNA-binding IclR family transcriptional regulator